MKFVEWLKAVRELLIVLGVLLSVTGYLYAQISTLKHRLDRVDFLAVVAVCNSGKYTEAEIKQIKLEYSLNKLDVDNLIAEWYLR